MADGQVSSTIQLQTAPRDGGGHTATSSVLYAILAGVAICGPLLVIMGLAFLASVSLLVVMSPLLIIFSPLLFIAGAILTLALVGFTVAIGTAVAGILAIGWTFMSHTGPEGRVGGEGGACSGKMITIRADSGPRVLEE